MRWYRRVAANEIYNFEVFYHENIELKMRDMIRGIECDIDVTVKSPSTNWNSGPSTGNSWTLRLKLLTL